MTPYYDDGTCVIYHGDSICGGVIWEQTRLWTDDAAVLVTDPPYGIAYHSNRPRVEGNPREIEGDDSTQLRDLALSMWGRATPVVLDPMDRNCAPSRPALIFGSPRVAKPRDLRGLLVWDPGGALGMGDLSLPWKFSHQEIYVLGGPWAGSRDTGSVIRCAPVQSVGREHPHEKPVSLMVGLLSKCVPGTVADPFMGTGTTLVAAKSLGRRAVGFEIEERYCEIAAKRLAQEVLPFGETA